MGGYQRDAINLPDVDAKLRVAIAATSTAEAALPGPPGGALLVTANTDCYAVFGATGVSAASTSNFTLFVPAGAAFLMRKHSTKIYVRAIRDSADGVLAFTSVEES